jgi:hypothetical protein
MRVLKASAAIVELTFTLTTCSRKNKRPSRLTTLVFSRQLLGYGGYTTFYAADESS